MARSVRINFTEDRGIYGRVETPGHTVSADNPFVVFKALDGVWTVAHRRTGMVVTKLLPPRITRSRTRLLLWLEEMAREMPEAVAMMALVESADMLAGEFREYGQALMDWSARYVCV